MPEVMVPIEGIQYPHLAAKSGPADHGIGRRCAVCGGKVNRYTTPQPLTGEVRCNLHWSLPSGYEFSPTGRIVKERAA